METSFSPVNLNTESQRSTVHSIDRHEHAVGKHEAPLEQQVVLPDRHVRTLPYEYERIALEFVQILTSIQHKTEFTPGERIELRDHVEPVRSLTPTPHIETRKSIEPELKVKPVESVVAYAPIADKPAGTPLPPPWRMPLPVDPAPQVKSVHIHVEGKGSRIDMTV